MTSLGRLVLLSMALGLAACGPNKPSAQGPQDTDGSVTRKLLGRRPALSLVERAGDPSPALAAAAALDLPPRAIAAMAALVDQRLRRSLGSDVSVFAHGLGYVVSQRITDSKSSARFIAGLKKALSAPVSKQEAEQIRGRVDKTQFPLWRQPVEVSAGRCAGRLGSPRSAQDVAVDANALNQWRELHGTHSVALGAVGTRRFLDSAAKALAQSDDWNRGKPVNETWQQSLEVGAGPAEQTRLTLTTRLASGGLALDAESQLLQADSAFRQQLSVLDDAWRAEAQSVLHPVGACLSVTLTNGEVRSAEEGAHAAAVASREIDLLLGKLGADQTPKREAWILEQHVTEAVSAEQAAMIAAWQMLYRPASSQAVRRTVHFAAPGASASKFEGEFKRAVRQLNSEDLEVKLRQQAGHGRFWLLVASPCGTGLDSRNHAGAAAVWLRATALSAKGDSRLEPWITADALGLIASGRATAPDETPAQVAERVARDLARAIVTKPTTGQIIRGRHELLQDLGEPQRPWAVALNLLSDDRPSLLDARGDWDSIGRTQQSEVANFRKVWLQSPLRVAMLSSVAAEQTDSALSTLKRWLGPARFGSHECPLDEPQPAKPGLYTLKLVGAQAATAVVAASLPPRSPFTIDEANHTAWLLDRAGGWLDVSLIRSGMASEAHAVVLGGSLARALLIRITAQETAIDAAIERTRQLLLELASGGVTEQDARLARRHFQQQRARARQDARYRLTELWHDPPDPTRSVSLESLRRFHSLQLLPDRHIVVVGRPSP